MARDRNDFEPIEFPVQMGGYNSTTPDALLYPDAKDAQNVRFGFNGEAVFRSGFTTYNSTAMPATVRAVTGLAQFNRRDTTTRYTICGTQEKLFVVPTSGAWTTLASSLGAGVNDYWDFAVFNNELICVNGVSTPQITDGTAGGTGSLSARAWQTKTSSSVKHLLHGLLSTDDEFRLISIGGIKTIGGTAADLQGTTERYETSTDTWIGGTSLLNQRERAAVFSAFGNIYAAGGANGFSAALTATAEFYSDLEDTWYQVTGMGTARYGPFGLGINNGGHVVGGSTNYAVSATVTTNQYYDPATDTWITKTVVGAARAIGASPQQGHLGLVAGGYSGAADLATAQSYNPFTNAWTNVANMTSERIDSGTASGLEDGKGYVLGGSISGTQTATVDTYSFWVDTWANESNSAPAVIDRVGAARSQYWVYAHGGRTGAGGTEASTLYRMNIAPTAPVAFYVESFRGHVFLSRTSSFPSRVWYSFVGDARQWNASAFFDVNPDDGDWITGMFVFNGRLYVSKTDVIYEITGSVFDPEDGDFSIVPLENVKGTVSNRSIVVTDNGVYYLAEDGFRRFDGVRSERISRKIQTTLDGFVDSRNKYVAGLWNRSRDEIWWSMTASGSTHNRIMVYNFRLDRWSYYTGIAAEAMANVEDANDVDQLLFGTGSASDGRIYTAETGNTDAPAGVTTAIDCVYQTGWFSPTTILRPFQCRAAYLMLKRFSSSVPTLTVSARVNYATSDAQDANNATMSRDIALNGTSSTSPATFVDAADQRGRMDMAFESTPHAMALRFAHNANADRCEIYGAVITGTVSAAGGSFPS